jgi:hypothetical protein
VTSLSLLIADLKVETVEQVLPCTELK